MRSAHRESGGELKRKRFGDLIRTARQARDLSQATLARATRISPVFISQIETGQRIPSDRVARKLAMALGLQWQEVLRMVYRLRSREAGELFEALDSSVGQKLNSIYDIPAVRSLLLQLAGLNLLEREIEALVRNWNNDVTLLMSLANMRGR